MAMASILAVATSLGQASAPWSLSNRRSTNQLRSLCPASLKPDPSSSRLRARSAASSSPRGLPPLTAIIHTLADVNSADDRKSESLPPRRVVFNHEDWQKHNSSGRHFRHFHSMVTSKVIGTLGPPVAVIAAIACAVVAWNSLVVRGLLPTWAKLLHMSSLPFTLASPALSLLLVFRTNSSYARFDEARKLWGMMLNRIRDICRQSLTYMARDQHTHQYPRRAHFLRYLQAFPLILKHHLRREGSLEEDLRTVTVLREEEIREILASKHRPNHCLHVMSECMGRCHMSDSSRLAMEQNFSTFADDIGGSERLLKTPIPLSYTRLTSRFLVLYHLFLPLALYDALGWLTVLATVIHAGIFFSIEEVGVLIENPFPVLDLDAIAASARDSVAEMVSLHEGVRDQVSEKYELCLTPMPESIGTPWPANGHLKADNGALHI